MHPRASRAEGAAPHPCPLSTPRESPPAPGVAGSSGRLRHRLREELQPLKVGRPSVCPPRLTARGIRSALPTWTALPGKAQAQMSPVLLPKVPAPPAPPLHLVPCLGRADSSFFSQNLFAVLSSPTLSDSRGCPPWHPAALHVNICQVNQMVTPSLSVDILHGSGAWCLGLSQGGSGSAARSPSALEGLVYGE